MFWIRILPAVAWAFFIFLLCGLPPKNTGSFSFWDLFSIDKLLHFAVFSALSLILIVALKRQCTFNFLRHRATIIAIILSLMYGITLEYIQMRYFEGRTGEWLDTLANSLGAIFGVIIFKIIYGNTRIAAS